MELELGSWGLVSVSSTSHCHLSPRSNTPGALGSPFLQSPIQQSLRSSWPVDLRVCWKIKVRLHTASPSTSMLGQELSEGGSEYHWGHPSKSWLWPSLCGRGTWQVVGVHAYACQVSGLVLMPGKAGTWPAPNSRNYILANIIQISKKGEN